MIAEDDNLLTILYGVEKLPAVENEIDYLQMPRSNSRDGGLQEENGRHDCSQACGMTKIHGSFLMNQPTAAQDRQEYT